MITNAGLIVAPLGMHEYAVSIHAGGLEANGTYLVEGPVSTGSMAVAGDRGISKVEVSVDGGRAWEMAQLKSPLSNLAWVSWAFEWSPTRTGQYNVYARATDNAGDIQTSNQTNTFPNGATGYAMTSLTVVN
jgi:hypothetical protein